MKTEFNNNGTPGYEAYFIMMAAQHFVFDPATIANDKLDAKNSTIETQISN